MSCLIIHNGEGNCTLKSSNKTTFLYRIGSGCVSGRDLIFLNDPKQLYHTALTLRDPYVEWIYSLNQRFVSRRLIDEELSLFFLTDLSNKRNELFDTYEAIANLCLIRERLKDVEIEEVELFGADRAFVESIRSIFPTSRVLVRRWGTERVRFGRRLMADALYSIRVITASLVNLSIPKQKSTEHPASKKRYFFSFFPQTFNNQLSEIRYGEMVGPNDAHLVSIIADGMHQQVPIRDYPRLAATLRSPKFALIDRNIRVRDLNKAVSRYCKFHWFRYRERKTKFVFQDIVISRYIQQELIWSASRVARFAVVERALDRTIRSLGISELVYPNFEYAFGRMISALLGSKYRDIVRIGFNHGDYSWRFVNYFLAEGEAASNPPYLAHCPIPDRVWAEDELCAEIYRYNGYNNVEIMIRVERLAYLATIKPRKLSRFALIAAGLHDGSALLQCMYKTIVANPNVQFLFKAHPRARNSYLEKLPALQNLQVIDMPIEDLLAYVGVVYVTYSGVGVEASRLGIRTVLVDMPGRVSWSKLLDYHEDHIYGGIVPHYSDGV